MSRSRWLFRALALPADKVPPSRVATTSQVDGHPPSATTIAGTVVTSSNSMMRGLVTSTYRLMVSRRPPRCSYRPSRCIGPTAPSRSTTTSVSGPEAGDVSFGSVALTPPHPEAPGHDGLTPHAAGPDPEPAGRGRHRWR